jgi:hypothetical protein
VTPWIARVRKVTRGLKDHRVFKVMPGQLARKGNRDHKVISDPWDLKGYRGLKVTPALLAHKVFKARLAPRGIPEQLVPRGSKA